ncbi:hypothetical protein ACE02Y_20170 [Shewanella xiamenensis]|uniref:hypothetical protein n=1 Tax=Shewanella xiamenensis TaxID=332186 RepID=UPI00313ADC5F
MTIENLGRRGRLPRNRVEILRTRVLMEKVCAYAGIAVKGYQCERLFEPGTITRKDDGTRMRSCKWDRYLLGTHSPSPQTLKKVYDHMSPPQAKALQVFYEHPMWVALADGPLDADYWQRFYQSLPISIQQLIFKRNTSGSQPKSLKIIRESTVQGLLRIWNHDAFACLLALCRDKSVTVDFQAQQSLSFAVHKYVQYLLISDFSHIPMLLWTYFEQVIVEDSRLSQCHLDLWQGGFEQTFRYAQAMLSFLLAAEDLGIVGSLKSQQLFLYWKLQGDTQLINQELAQAFSDPHGVLPETKLGLNWLIAKMNKHLAKHQQVSIRH